MLIEETFVVAAPRADVASFLLDVARMGSCVPGIDDLRQVGEDRYEAVLVVRLGPIQARFQGDVDVDASGAPDSISARAQGQDRATGSVAQVDFSASLSESGSGGTEVHTVSDVAIRGRLGQFGSGVIAATAREMIKEFAQCAQQALSSEENRPVESSSAQDTTRSVGLLSVLWRGVLAWARGLWARLVSRDRRQA